MKNILILCNSKLMALTIKNFLETMENKNIFWADSHQKALEIIQNEKIDLLMSEVELKDLTLFDFKNKYSDVATLAIVDKSNREDLKPWCERAQIEMMTFPFSSVELKEVLNRILGKEDLLSLPI